MSDDGLLSSYQFDLPQELIAQEPAVERDQSRLLVLPADGEMEEKTFSDLPDLLRPGDLLIRNNVKVMPARLLGKRQGGGAAELLLVRREERDGGEYWQCLARPGNRFKPGKQFFFGDTLTATALDNAGNGAVWVDFSLKGDAFMAELERVGEVPLPPYIDRPGRKAADRDRERYQTVYAKRPGAVAAPTAGLHFTPGVDARLRDIGVEIAEVTLNVGPGTFRPIKEESLDRHRMDAEWYEIPEETWSRVETARREGRRVIAVGTTSVRTLESAAAGDAPVLNGWTELFIRPGYDFKVIDGLVTNFHLPGSSLLVLISALAGRERVLAAYRRAVAGGYRFYSYGDAMLIERRKER